MKHYLINPTWRCHNRCTYCWLNESIRRRKELMGAAERPMQDWAEAINRDGLDVVDIAGGEPFLLDWIGELVDACPQTRFGLSTNGLAYETIRDFCRKPHRNVIAVNVSFHPDTASKFGGSAYLRRWRESVNLLRGARYNTHVNIIDFADNLPRSQQAIAWMEQAGVKYEISPYEDVFQLAHMTKLGLCCQGGVNHLTVAPDGQAWPCLTAIRSPYWTWMRLGNWLDGTVDVSKKPQPCFLNCVDYYILPQQHEAGDMWQIEARPCEEGAT